MARQIPFGVVSPAFIPMRHANDRFAWRIILDAPTTMYRFYGLISLDGAVGITTPYAASSGTNASGNGGTLHWRLCRTNSSTGGPDLSRVKASQEVTAANSLAQLKDQYSSTLVTSYAHSFATSEFDDGELEPVDLAANTCYWVVLSNSASDPSSNWFSVVAPSIDLSDPVVYGPNAVNYPFVDKPSGTYAVLGLDEREVCAWSVTGDSGPFYYGQVGGTKGQARPSASGPGAGAYTDKYVAPAYAWSSDDYPYSEPIFANQPWLAMNPTLTANSLHVYQAKRTVTVTKVGAVSSGNGAWPAAPEGNMTFTNHTTGSSSTASYGSFSPSNNSSVWTGTLTNSVVVSAGDHFSISCTEAANRRSLYTGGFEYGNRLQPWIWPNGQNPNTDANAAGWRISSASDGAGATTNLGAPYFADPWPNYTSSASSDTTAPAVATSLTASQVNGQTVINLSVVVPAEGTPDRVVTYISRKTSPWSNGQAFSSGTVVLTQAEPSPAGQSRTFTVADSSLSDGQTYYYRAFTVDSFGNWADGPTASQLVSTSSNLQYYYEDFPGASVAPSGWTMTSFGNTSQSSLSASNKMTLTINPSASGQGYLFGRPNQKLAVDSTFRAVGGFVRSTYSGTGTGVRHYYSLLTGSNSGVPWLTNSSITFEHNPKVGSWSIYKRSAGGTVTTLATSSSNLPAGATFSLWFALNSTQVKAVVNNNVVLAATNHGLTFASNNVWEYRGISAGTVGALNPGDLPIVLEVSPVKAMRIPAIAPPARAYQTVTGIKYSPAGSFADIDQVTGCTYYHAEAPGVPVATAGADGAATATTAGLPPGTYTPSMTVSNGDPFGTTVTAVSGSQFTKSYIGSVVPTSWYVSEFIGTSGNSVAGPEWQPLLTGSYHADSGARVSGSEGSQYLELICRSTSGVANSRVGKIDPTDFSSADSRAIGGIVRFTHGGLPGSFAWHICPQWGVTNLESTDNWLAVTWDSSPDQIRVVQSVNAVQTTLATSSAPPSGSDTPMWIKINPSRITVLVGSTTVYSGAHSLNFTLAYEFRTLTSDSVGSVSARVNSIACMRSKPVCPEPHASVEKSGVTFKMSAPVDKQDVVTGVDYWYAELPDIVQIDGNPDDVLLAPLPPPGTYTPVARVLNQSPFDGVSD